MAGAGLRLVLLPLLLLLLLHVGVAVAELHRAKHQRAFPRSESAAPPPTDALDVLAAMYRRNESWLLSMVAAALVGFSGVLPLLVIPLETGARLKERDGEKRLRLLLSFAVGGLVGDVFLHLLPEAMRHSHSEAEQTWVGLWVIAGVFLFVLLELVFGYTAAQPGSESESESESESRAAAGTTPPQPAADGVRRRVVDHSSTNGHVVTNGHAASNGSATVAAPQQPERPQRKQVAGYLNLLANSVDNFTHGLAIGGSFLASTRIGLLTTFAILIHEIPHEVGDFAILLKSGFSRWEAAKAQMATATLGMTGAISALLADDPRALGDRTAWILPFTAGGFIHIALVGVLPEVCREREPLQCLKQVGCMVAGVLIMLTVTVVFEH